MNLAFYSETARRNIVAAREFAAERKFRPIPADIRRARHEIIALPDDAPVRTVTRTADFFSMSGCRDLLFHVQEHRLSLPAIAAFLAENDLELLGMLLPQSAHRAYERRFPADRARTDLANWHQFEEENPDTFIGMYRFWVQRR
jgi:hypothetical protein